MDPNTQLLKEVVSFSLGITCFFAFGKVLQLGFTVRNYILFTVGWWLVSILYAIAGK